MQCAMHVYQGECHPITCSAVAALAMELALSDDLRKLGCGDETLANLEPDSTPAAPVGRRSSVGESPKPPLALCCWIATMLSPAAD